MLSQLETLSYNLSVSSSNKSINLNNILNHFPQDVIFIHIYRKNIVKQAISHLVAVKSNKWHNSKKIIYTEYVPPSNYEIYKEIQKIKKENRMWKKILYTNKVKCYSVSYEDFVSKTEKHLRNIFDLSHIKKQKINLLSSVNIVEDKRKNILYENYKNQKKIDFIKHKYYLLCDTISDFFSYYFNILLRKANLKNDVLFRQLIQNSIDYYMSASISLSIVKIKTSHINKTKPVVLCLVKNGERYIDTFIEHYKNLGFEQMVFLDNNSSDKTLEMLHKYSLDNKISIYSSKLKYKKYGLYFKKYLQNKFGKENWNLLVDIDELWIPPLEFKNNLSKFISDIEKDNSTSVPGIMIDIYYNKNYFTSIKKKTYICISPYQMLRA